ncbi:DUF2155 domain-containing protein [Qipengyuania sp. DGS5-3]|uniref:DUF2155 domain-containing protein n=2 Tax=Erythrobacteraceae TaxID=335929 RepID=UPI0036D30EF3
MRLGLRTLDQMTGSRISRIVVTAAIAGMVAACGDSAPSEPVPASTEVPEELQQSAPPPEVPGEEAAIGTPLEERVATIGLLNKRNNVSQDIELKPGETQRLGNVIVRLQSCERTAPWELPQETGAFVQVLVERADEADQFDRIFSGWLFKNSPALNVVEHPVYDVWVKDCAMSFPGEEA